ncbi:GNAT family N-acetyltransferase [Phytomonospora endophytica]|uniref:Ribosomal protein S18 acetylase RimI-like enzyme n=1 Tax=Phytomonospora endophytica TaxID=714109 RepID=A0A841G396_9ACTN|nr:GNAT family N-acetyltransferase [Phytomonospora endophytica]MBB6039189.1 ribosomal protein S18 acetylase RimI-like enzyme [Phytomonospora endophytica]GIG67574.1 N-acetyltransferase [Phytomonospora endophytica]
MAVEVRVATPGDYPEAGRIAVDAYRKHGHLGDADGPASFYAEQLADAASRAADGTLLVAVDPETGDVLGTVAYLEHGSPMAEMSAPGEAEFRMLAVDPRAERRGVGKALVNACVERARANGRTAVAICSRDDVAVGAMRLYERLGFVRTPEKDWEPVAGISLIGWRIEV